MSAFRRFLLTMIVAMAALSARAGEPSTAVRGIAAEGKRPESERVLSASTGDTITLHLRNDMDGAVAFQALAGDCTSGKAVLRSEQVLVDPPKSKGITPLASWLLLAFVFRGEAVSPFIFYIAKPGDEFDVVITLTALRDPKDPKSPRVPLTKGSY